ncbi:hypothetical protein HLRTI_000396 [Halorhabdus tiamatea SARL4B]|uniref:Uncharacterized protein n=1 Tax=Halorhabdus tiamatea SARL4B TaxID=1033806 RepID=U2FBG3_9EURY|nr:hypothetical protein HLRTI_000396 [Halorhabdus tiamatea SARL4B]
MVIIYVIEICDNIAMIVFCAILYLLTFAHFRIIVWCFL